jgi:hypothetical protein
MKKQKIILFVLAFVVIGATARLCSLMETGRKLGAPGVKLVLKPSLDVDGKIVREQSVDLPENVSGFESKAVGLSHEELRALPVDTLFGRRNYWSSNNFYVTASVVVMGNDSRSIHKPEICLPSQGWKITEQPTTIHMQNPIPYELPVVKVIGSKMIPTADGSAQPLKTVFVYWFVAENEITADHLTRMWRMGEEMLRTGTLQRWAYIAFISPCFPGQEEATYQRIEDFIKTAVPEFQISSGKSAKASLPATLQTASK